MNVVTRIANSFDDELRFDPFWLLGEQKYSGQIQQAFVRCQIHILQELRQILSK